MKENGIYGLIAEFEEPDQVLAAARQARAAGYRRVEAYTPYLVEDLAEELGMHNTGVPLICLLCGITGGLGGYGMEYFAAAIHYPINVGGRPLHSWPAFIPITFELTVLFAALGTVIGMLILNGLPRPHHPVFETPFFEQRNQSHFYLCIEAKDPLFDRTITQEFLLKQKPAHVWEVPA
ncbi:quinol:cytochrome c oxidoreductase membrane protein [Chthoniobacter flavus]|uniref:DUF3341 domain-containing protein n=1 Tax=Chthoniobacter flavus TaxID=191863 RepID=UPI0010461E14|nr:DUF3341 domain-containing protein [Chthoniobacter flavus]TCO87229.1 quinol:cytochrome c oxidoreductase membrane protein [Chthoniobacter flavus]